MPLVGLWCTLLVCVGVAAATAAPSPTPLEAGIRAYRAGNFDTALARFLEARSQHEGGSTLLFNLGLSYYRLGNYGAARQTFLELRQYPDMVAVAEYHLGLVAAQIGQMDRATAHLRAAAAGEPAGVRLLARTALARLRDRPVARESAAYAAAGIGFDSNRNQISDTIQIAGQQPESAYADLSGALQYPLPRFADMDLQASVFQRDYTTDDVLDQKAIQLSLRRAWRSDPWRITFAAESDAIFLDGKNLMNAYGLNLEGLRRTGSSTLRLRYRPGVISAGSDYAYLGSQRNRADISQEFFVGEFQVRAGYEVETNDPRDLALDKTFFGQPPLRHGPFLRVSHNLTPDLSLDFNAAYRHSRYREADHYAQYGIGYTERRVENLAYLGLAAQLKLGLAWGVRLDYRYTDNRSSLDTYDYRRQLVLVALEWRY